MSAFPLAVLFTVGHQELAVFLDSESLDKYLWEEAEEGISSRRELTASRGPQWECPSEAERPLLGRRERCYRLN